MSQESWGKNCTGFLQAKPLSVAKSHVTDTKVPGCVEKRIILFPLSLPGCFPHTSQWAQKVSLLGQLLEHHLSSMPLGKHTVSGTRFKSFPQAKPFTQLPLWLQYTEVKDWFEPRNLLLHAVLQNFVEV